MPRRRRENLSIFDGFVVFSIPPIGKHEPSVKFTYAPNGFSVPVDQLLKFCFPYAETADASLHLQRFSFSLTDEFGNLAYGHCLQKEPATPASEAYCFCIVSCLPWFDFFEQVLQSIDSLHIAARGQELTNIEQLVDQIYNHPAFRTSELETPSGRSIVIQVASKNFAMKLPDSRLLLIAREHFHFQQVANCLSPNNLIAVFASVLFERRILLTSSKLFSLSCAAHLLSQITYPLAWQHVFIPVMPSHLLDYTCATMPYIIGVHQSLLSTVQSQPLEEHVLVDLDNDIVQSPFSDREVLPADMISILKRTLKHLRSPKSSLHHVQQAAEAFLSVFTTTMDGYRHFLRPSDHDNFVDVHGLIHAKPPKIQPLVEAVAQTQMFSVFAHEAVDVDEDDSSLSDRRPTASTFDELLVTHKNSLKPNRWTKIKMKSISITKRGSSPSSITKAESQESISLSPRLRHRSPPVETKPRSASSAARMTETIPISVHDVVANRYSAEVLSSSPIESKVKSPPSPTKRAPPPRPPPPKSTNPFKSEVAFHPVPPPRRKSKKSNTATRTQSPNPFVDENT